MKTGPKPRSLAERFFESFLPEPNSGCWLWMGSYSSTGYGRLSIGSRTDDNRQSVLAHRVSWELHRAPLPAGAVVCHRCDNPACVNPDHLFVGTQKDNVADMVSKGRARKPDLDREVCFNGHDMTVHGFTAFNGWRRCRVCARAASRRHYARNVENERERNRVAYWSDPEKARARSLASYHKSKET